MEVIINQDGSDYAAAVNGRIDTTNADQFLQSITPLIEAKSANITLDCRGLEYTSSQGLRMFLTLQKAVMANGGSLVLVNMNPNVKEVFDITGFSSIIKIL